MRLRKSKQRCMLREGYDAKGEGGAPSPYLKSDQPRR